MYIVKAKIKGVEPGLLMHKFPLETEAELQTNTKKVGKHNLSAEEEAERAAYRLETGELYQPAEHIFQAMVKAAGQFQIRGRGKSTYRDVVKGHVVISPECILHGQKVYAIDARPVRIQKARVMRRRPLLAQWELVFGIQVLDDDILPRDVLKAILVKAGEAVGIGDYRPRYGRFIVLSFD
jgi:hypothetical protein